MISRDFLQKLVEDEKDTARLPLLQRLIGLSRQRASAEMFSQLDDADLAILANELKLRIDSLKSKELTSVRRSTIKMYLGAALRYVTTEQTSRLYDCQSCGACCRAGGVIMINALDAPDVPVELTVKSVFLPCARMKKNDDEACVALAGVIGESVACDIHAERSDTCRRFTAGTPACLSARKKCGISPSHGLKIPSRTTPG